MDQDDFDWSLEAWGALLNRLIDQILEHRALFILHERNRAALEEMHTDRHDADHDDLEVRLQEALGNPAISLADRVRMAGAFGAVFGALIFTGNVFADVASDELSGLLRGAVSDLLHTAPPGP
jgi:hypothetical protein